MGIPHKDLLLDTIAACTNLYGLTPFVKLVEIYNSQNEQEIQLRDLLVYVDAYEVKDELEKRFTYVHEDAFVADALIEDDKKAQLEKETAGKPFYVPEKEELLRFADQFYFQRTAAHERLRGLLVEDFGDSMDTEAEIEELVLNLQVSGGEFTFELSEFLSRLELPVTRAEHYIPVIIDMANTTRLWENRGHTPEEMRMDSFE